MLSTSSLHILFHSTPLVLLLHLILIRFLCKCWKLKDMLNAVTLNTPLFFCVYVCIYFILKLFNFFLQLPFSPSIFPHDSTYTIFPRERGRDVWEDQKEIWVGGWVDWLVWWKRKEKENLENVGRQMILSDNRIVTWWKSS